MAPSYRDESRHQRRPMLGVGKEPGLRYESACTVGQDRSEPTSSSRDRSAAQQQALWDGSETWCLWLSFVTRIVTRRDSMGAFRAKWVGCQLLRKPLGTSALSSLDRLEENGGIWPDRVMSPLLYR